MVNQISIQSDFNEYKKAFLEENAKHNLISKLMKNFYMKNIFMILWGLNYFSINMK